MENSTTPIITGQESLWGAVKAPTSDELQLINSSPLLVQQLLDYQHAIDQGSAAPMGEIPSVSGGNPYSYQTSALPGGPNGSILQIQLGAKIIGADTTTFVSALSYELGHVANYSNDQQLYNSMALNANDQNDPIISGVWGIRTEAESAANNYAVQQQILQSTGVLIPLSGNSSSNGLLQATLDAAYADAKAAGTDASQILPQLAQAVSPIMDSFQAVTDNYGDKVNFFHYYTEDPQSAYNYTHPSTAKNVSSTQGPQSPDTDDVDFTYNPSNGSLEASHIQFSDGSAETLNFAGSQVSSAVYTDQFGNIVSAVAYTHNADGSYSATVSDGTGALVSTQQFLVDGSEIDTVTNPATVVDVNASGVVLTTNADEIDVNGQDYDTIILNGNHVINAQAGDNFQLTGVGYDVNLSATGAASTVTFGANSGGAVTGSGATVNAVGSGSVGISGANNTINTSPGTAVTLNNTNGNFDTVNSNGDQSNESTGSGISLASNTQANVDGSNNEINEATGDSLGVYGGGNVISVASGADLVVGNTNGSFDTVTASGDAAGGTTANGQNTGIWINGNAQANINGDNDSLGVNAGDSVGVYGGGNVISVASGADLVVGNTNGSFDTVTASGDAAGGTTANGQNTGIWINSNAQANINGDNDNLDVSAGDSIGVYGGGNTINATGGVDLVVGNTDGSLDTINATGVMADGVAANGQGTGIWINSNAQASVVGDNNTASLSGANGGLAVNGENDTVDISGNGNELSLSGTGDVVNVTGQNQSITASNASIYGESDDTFGVSGSNDTITDGTSSTTTVEGSNDTLSYIAGDSTVSVLGQNDVIDGSDDTIYGNNNDTLFINGTGDTITDGTSSTTTVEGSNDTLSYIAGDSTVSVLGQNDVIDGSDDTIYGNNNDTLSITGSGDTITDGDGSTTYISGNDDFLSYAGTGSYIGIDGEDNNISASGDTIDFTGSVGGDIVDGTDDSGSGWVGVDYIDSSDGGGMGAPTGGGDTGGGDTGGGDTGGGDTGGGDTGGGDQDPEEFGAFGFSGNRTAVTNMLSGGMAPALQANSTDGNSASMVAAQNGFAQAAEMSQDAQTSAGAGPNVFEGARWNAPTITWSFSGASDPQEAQYESSIEQAFATWAAASGLQFDEVSASSSADISINWADLNAPSTGEVGYTTFEATKGVIASGASISLESTTQDALVSGNDGSQTYAGTDATFYQTVLHEIGHALGLADNADVNSIMNYDLTSSNRTLDQTDINAIEALYGSSAQTAALIQVMAGGTSHASGTTSTPVEQASMQTQLLAGTH
ncbi:beta strand repeat-containing protein [Burkholderia gladioli]|uniref:beta strand repeat-containing protein n=1 Tax=Burkholderia gladioli TaxID=28095 RepID=UPI001641E393|nr:matrixin family metalloprotease [Burkholderia gladioli]